MKRCSACHVPQAFQRRESLGLQRDAQGAPAGLMTNCACGSTLLWTVGELSHALGVAPALVEWLLELER